MEKKGQWRYTKNISEVHEKVIMLFHKNSSLELKKECFISALWIENFMSKGSVFMVVTSSAIFHNSNGPFEQININTIEGMDNVVLLTINTIGGKKITPFKTVIIPKQILSLILGDIHKAQAGNNTTMPTTIFGVDDLAKFKKLLDDGVLTQEEFDKKKAQILGL